MTDQSPAAAILSQVETVDWAAYIMGPTLDSYDPPTVTPAFAELLESTTDLEAHRAYNRVLDTIIHNHSGWLYAASVPAAVILAKIVRDMSGAPQQAAIEVLIDLLSWASPDLEFVDPHGSTIALRQSIQDAVTSLQPTLLTLANPTPEKPLIQLAADLLEVLHDTGQTPTPANQTAL